jgi:hypothetical protein
MEKKELYQKNCKQTSAYNNAWSLKKQNGNRILFTLKYKNRAISIPKKSSARNPTPKIVRKTPATVSTPSKVVKRTTTHTNNKLPYSIQIGTFNYETSLPLLYQEFQLLKDLLITKKIIKNEQVQYKVYLGSFPDLLEAQVKLQELRSEYINSKTLKSAFITKLP